MKAEVRVDGRDMGEMTGGIKGGMQTAEVLYLRAFRVVDGRDSRLEACLDD